MLFVTIHSTTYQEAKNKIRDLGSEVDGIELRLDYLESIDLINIQELMIQWGKPVLFTLRKKSHGGHFKGTEQEHEVLIEKLLELHPDYLDLEIDTPLSFIKRIALEHSELKLVCSLHNFQETPHPLTMQTPFPAYAYKIATMSHSIIDTLRVIQLCRKQNGRMIGIAMGEQGQIARILGPIMGNSLNYASFAEEEAVAPGQLDYKTLCTTYHFKELNPETQIYGLIGHPVVQSPSHITHNRIFQENKIDAVYVKMDVQSEELSGFFDAIESLPFQGLSVTIPHKEAVLPFLAHLDRDAQAIGAVNTLVRKENGWWGYNTDGIGALDAIEAKCPVKNKKLLILGTGGTSKAIAFEARKRGAEVIVAGRTSQVRLDAVARENYDILVNTTPVGMQSDEMPILPSQIIPGTVVMDAIYAPKETKLLCAAAEKKCQLVYGHEMWINQARAQFHLWLPNLNGALDLTL